MGDMKEGCLTKNKLHISVMVRGFKMEDILMVVIRTLCTISILGILNIEGLITPAIVEYTAAMVITRLTPIAKLTISHPLINNSFINSLSK